MFDNHDILKISRTYNSKQAHSQRTQSFVNYATTHVNDFRHVITGENIVNQALPNDSAKYDLTLFQKHELMSGKFNLIYRHLQSFKVDHHIASQYTKKLEENTSDASLKSSGVALGLRAKVALSIVRFCATHKSTVHYMYHYPHIVHLKNTSTRLLSNNPWLDNLLKKKYPGKNVEDIIERRNAGNAIMNHKDAEIAYWQKPKYKTSDYPIGFKDDPYLRVVLYTSQHHKFSKGTYKMTDKFMNHMQYVSYRVIRNQMEYNYIPLNQRSFDIQNHKALNTDTKLNAQDEKHYSIIDHGRQDTEKKLIDKNILKHIDTTSTSAVPVKFKHGLWSSYRELHQVKPVSEKSFAPNFNNSHSKRKIKQLIGKHNSLHR